MHASKHPHTFQVLPFAGGARTIAPGEVVDFDEVIGCNPEGAPLTLRHALTAEQLEQFEPVAESPARGKRSRTPDLPATEE